MIKSFSLELKHITEEGTFQGIASTYNNVDATGDVVEPGAFTRTLGDSGSDRPLLWQHSSPVGLVKLTDSAGGLMAAGKLSMGLQLARDALVLLKDGVVKGLSIGFSTVREEFVGEVRHLKEVRLWEVSLVTFPANEMAQVLSVKTLEHRREEREAVARAAQDLRVLRMKLHQR